METLEEPDELVPPQASWVRKSSPHDASPRFDAEMFVRVLIGVGLGMLWMSGLLVAFVNIYGDCFSDTATCEAAYDLARQRAQALLAGMVLLSVIGVWAFVSLGRRRLLLLFFASVAAWVPVALDEAVKPYTVPYLPGGLVFIGPALLCLTVAAALGMARNLNRTMTT